MAEKFKPAFAISDGLILVNLHNAAYEKMEVIKGEKTVEFGGGDKKKELKVKQKTDQGIGNVINSGCRNDLKNGPDATAFKNKASVYEIGIVLSIEAAGSSDEPSTENSDSYGENDVKALDPELMKVAVEPIKSYMKVFAGKDAANKIKDGDVHIIHFNKISSKAVQRSSYIIDDFLIDGKSKGFGYALCKIRYSVGLGK